MGSHPLKVTDSWLNAHSSELEDSLLFTVLGQYTQQKQGREDF